MTHWYLIPVCRSHKKSFWSHPKTKAARPGRAAYHTYSVVLLFRLHRGIELGTVKHVGD